MIFISTANGKVGQEIVKTLQAQNTSIRIGARNTSKAQAAFPGASIVPFDYNNPESIKAALEGVSAVYLAAPGDFPAEPEKHVVDLAKSAGVERIVKLSAKGIEHAPETPLRQVEQHIEQSGLAWTFVRPTWFMQNYSTGMAESIRNGTLYEPTDDARTAFIDARDIAAVAVKALSENGHNRKAYALTGSESLDRHEVAHIISSATGKPLRYQPINDEQFRNAMQNVMTPTYLELMSNIYGIVRAGQTAETTKTVAEVLGREPIGFAQFAQDHKNVWL